MRGWLSKVVTAGNKRRDEGYGPTATGGGHTYGRGPGGMMMMIGHQQRSGANAGEELVKAQQIPRICEQLKQEIQRILKSAKDVQNMYGGSRWPGASELLALLGGGMSPELGALTGGEQQEVVAAGEEREDSSHHLLGALEELMGHSHFTARCLETALAPNLGHCLRLMRVIELEAAAPTPSVVPPPAPPPVPPHSTRSGRSGPTSSSSAHMPAPVPVDMSFMYPKAEPGKPITIDATTRIARILVKLCQEGAVVEQLRHHMEGLFKLTTACYPPTGVHIQSAACEVVEAISTHSLSSSLVWFIHDRQIVMQMADDMADLCRVGGSTVQDEDGDLGGDGLGNDQARTMAAPPLLTGNSLTDVLLSGAEAEEAGMWLTAVRAIVTLVCHSCKYSAALLSDLEEARGYAILKLMVLESSPSRRPEVLARLVQLVGAGAENVSERHDRGSGGGPEDAWTVGQQARNAKAFDVIRDVLIEATPFLSKALGVPEEGEGAGSALSGTSRLESSWVPKSLANVSREALAFLRRRAGMAYGPEDMARETLQLHLLSTVLQIYSNHPRNYSILEPKFLVLSLYLASLSSFLLTDLKVMVIKTLEYVCSGVANCAPTLALYAASYTLTTGCECFLTNPPFGNEADAFVNAQLKENVELVCSTFEKLIQFDHMFVDTLCTSGVVSEVLLPLLVKAVQLKDRKPRPRVDGSCMLLGCDDALVLVCRLLCTMLHPDEHEKLNADASKCLRSVRLYAVLHTVVGELGPPSTQAALRVLELGALADRAPDKETPSPALVENLTFLVELLQSCRHERWRQLVVLRVIKSLLTLNAHANDLWRSLCGFEAAIAALSSLDGAFIVPHDRAASPPEEPLSPSADVGDGGPFHSAARSHMVLESDDRGQLQQLLESPDEQEISLELIKQILRTITIAVSGKVLGNLRARVENRQYLKNEIGYLTLKQCLLNAKVLTRERYSRDIVDCVFAMVTEEASLPPSPSCASLSSTCSFKASDRATIKNADAVLLLLALLTELPRRVAVYILKKLLQLIANSTYVATEQLCTAGALRQVVVQFRDILHDPDDPLYPLLLRLLCLSGRHRINVPDAISILRCLAKPLLPNGPDDRIVLCHSTRRQRLLHPDRTPPKPALEQQWKSLLILAELAETSDSVPFLRLGGGRSDLLSLSRRWAQQEPKDIAMMDFDAVYAATAYSEGMRFLMVPTVGGTQTPTSSSGFSFSCWFRFGVEDTDDFTLSTLYDDERSSEEGEAGGGGEVQQRILWLLTVCSTSTKSSLQVYYDLTHRQICVESFVLKQQGAGLDTKVCPVELEPSMWHNLVLIYNRTRSGFLTNRSHFSLFIDGVEVTEAFRTDHISFLESHHNRCFIGVPLPDTLKVKPSVLQGLLSPIWHLGPHLLVSEALPGQAAAAAIFAGGPAYVGTFQGERPVHSSLNAVVTSLLLRTHRMAHNILAALLARGLQDVLRVDHRRDDDALLSSLLLRLPHEQIVFSFHAGHASPCQIEPPRREDGKPRSNGRSTQNLDIYHEPCYRLVNTLAHLSDEARSQWGVVFGDGVLMNPLCISDSVFGLSGPQIFFPLLEVADSPVALCIVLELVRVFCKGHVANLEYMQQSGYRVLVFLLGRKRALFTPDVLRACVTLAIDAKDRNAYHSKFSPDSTKTASEESDECVSKVLVDSAALRHLALNWELWGAGHNRGLFVMLLSQLSQLLWDRNPNSNFNAHRLHSLGMVRWTLSIMMQAAKLAAAGTPGWAMPPITLEDAHWGRSGMGGDELLNTCAELLHQLLATRMAEADMQDLACVLLSTVSHVRHSASARSRLFNHDPHARGVPHANASAVNRHKEVLSPQAVVRVCVMEVLVKLLTPRSEAQRKTNAAGSQGVVKKVMDFFTLDTVERLGGAKPATAGGQGLIQDDRQEMLRALGRCMGPEWFVHMLQGSRDSLSVALTLRILFVLLQERDDYAQLFSEVDGGFSAFTTLIQQHSAAPVALLPTFAVVAGVPVSQVALVCEVRSSHVFDVLEPFLQDAALLSGARLGRPHFGALMGALLGGLGKNIALVKGKGDEEVACRASWCVDEVLGALRSCLECIPAFREACRSKEFVTPLVTALFACADVVSDDRTSRVRSSVTGLQVPLNSYVTEDYLSTVASMDQDGTQAEPLTLEGTAELTSPAPLSDCPHSYFATPEAARLLHLASLVLHDAVFTPLAPTAQPSAPSLVKEFLVAFPSTADNAQVGSFHEALLSLLSELCSEALHSGEVVPVSHAVALVNVLFDDALCGLFSPHTLRGALELCLRVAQEVAGARLCKCLSSELQQLLLADAISLAQALTIVALRRTSGGGEPEVGAVVALVQSSLPLLLLPTRRPVLASATASGAQRQGQNTGWRKALAQTLTAGGLDDTQELLLMSPALELSRSMTNILRSEAPTKVDVFQVFAPEREESFVTCLLSELLPLLLDEGHYDPQARRDALRVCEGLLHQRPVIMKDLLAPEVKDVRSKERRVVDVYRSGFAMLSETSLGAMGDDDTLLDHKFRRFDFYLHTPEAQEDMLQVQRSVRGRALAVMSDEYMLPTGELLDRLRANKVTPFQPLVLGLTARPGRGDVLSRAYESFLSFHLHVLRSGLGDMASGSVHWKRVMKCLRGVGSVWEGADLAVDKDEKWPITPLDAKTAAREAHMTLRWKLDMTEGPERIRRRLTRNYEFDDIYKVLYRPLVGAAASDKGLGAEETPPEAKGQGAEGAVGERAEADQTRPMVGQVLQEGEEQGGEQGAGEGQGLVAGVGELPQDLRATAKLIKQVALVRRNSGARPPQGHRAEGQDELFLDEEEEEEEEEGAVVAGAAGGGTQEGGDLSSLTDTGGEDSELTIDMTSDGPEEDPAGGGGDLEGEGARRGSASGAVRGVSQGLLSASSSGPESAQAARRRREALLVQHSSSSSVEGARAEGVGDPGSMDRSAPVDRFLRQASSTEGDAPLQTPAVLGGGEGTMVTMEASTVPALFALQEGVGESMDEAQGLHDVVPHELLHGFVDEADGPLARLYNVQRCVGLETRQGLLLVCRHALVVVDGFTKVQGDAMGGWTIKRLPPPSPQGPTRFSVFLRDEDGGAEPPFAEQHYCDAVRSGREERQEAARQASTHPGTPCGDGSACASFDLDDPPNVKRLRFDRLKILYKRRHQFRHVGVEFFDNDGRSLLLAFDTVEDQLKVIELVLDSNLVNSVFAAESGKLGGGKVNYKRFMQHWKAALTSRWQNGRMSNFEYLMHLNALAGRSFHDLTQYPVFPWVIADYTSPELDLSSPASFRDLRKPMGALGESRARQFRERYEQLSSLTEDMSPEDAEHEPPPFHYGTHYSCAGYVLYYLLRLEPYTRLHLSLQGGKFDKPDRLFRDVRSSWESASRDNLQDVRELIPEFYCLPDFLANHNAFDFGWLQKGLAVNHVMLPPWAHGDAREFIRVQRLALESRYVSENLCYWIDLIFGSKQQGKEAIDAQNLFVHLTYENSAVDIDAIADPVIREATLAQINNFGQTPSRLFKRPHPQRKVPQPIQGSAFEGNRHVDVTALSWHAGSTPSLCMVGAPHKIALRHASDSQIGPPFGGALPTPLQPVGDVWILRDRAIGVGIDCTLVPPNLVKYARYMSPDNGLTFRVAAPTARHREIDRVVSVHEQLHLGWVSCLAIEEAGELAVTGSKDATVRVWSLLKHSSHKSMSLQATLCGHAGEVLCLDLAPQIGNLLSGGADRVAILWDLRDFTAVRLLLGHTSPVTSVSINKRTGDMVTLAGVDMRIWSISGELIAQVAANVAVKEVPTCVVATSCPDWQDGVVSITGHDNGKVCLWGLQHLSAEGPNNFNSSSNSNLNSDGVGGQAAGDGPSTPGREGGDNEESRGGEGSNSGIIQGRQIKLMQILAGPHHGSTITSLRVGREQRDLAVGDASGRLSRWTSLRLEEVSKDELAVLHV